MLARPAEGSGSCLLDLWRGLCSASGYMDVMEVLVVVMEVLVVVMEVLVVVMEVLQVMMGVLVVDDGSFSD